jgi:hypothetical protein
VEGYKRIYEECTPGIVPVDRFNEFIPYTLFNITSSHISMNEYNERIIDNLAEDCPKPIVRFMNEHNVKY